MNKLTMNTQIGYLQGFSGLKVNLIKLTNGKYIIKKQSNTIEQNKRLQIGKEKQIFFANLPTTPFLVPKIIEEGYTDKGLYYFCYEFIEGETLLSYIVNNSTKNIETIINKITNIVTYMLNNKIVFEKTNNNLYEMLLEKVINNCSKCQLDKEIKEKLVLKLKKIKKISNQTLCHGDFTFDNMIISKNKDIYLIDFLDTYPHVYLDIAKMFQDIEGTRYEIKHKITIPKNKMQYIKNRILDILKTIEPNYIDYHYILLTISLLRILPYATKIEDQNMLIEKILFFLDK